MKILHLTLKKQWFDMIKSGEKKEEYREVKEYWIIRLLQPLEWRMESYIQPEMSDDNMDGYTFEHFDIIRFTNGYGKDAPTFDIECKGITIGIGKKEWGAPTEQVFIISLGKIVNKI